MKYFSIILLLSFSSNFSTSWGFFAHKLINKHAVYSLPQSMNTFYINNIDLLEEKAVDADKRRYSDKDEAHKHYIDIDYYSVDSPFVVMPRYKKDAIAKFSLDTLEAYGILPWHINYCYYELVKAMKSKDAQKVIYLSADLGHYIADANVPLHTTLNYDGQLTNQDGIHAFWESRLPELFHSNYNLIVPKIEYIDNVLDRVWQTVEASHNAKDSVLLLEQKLRKNYDEDKVFSFEEKGGRSNGVYSKEYSEEYHVLLSGMVERQMRKSIHLTSSVWFTAWVDAGQPNMNNWE
tara:strand:+ start:5655 stop:6530 length:876 start_codon:yes stop_codon:yes gene_type:complete